MVVAPAAASAATVATAPDGHPQAWLGVRGQPLQVQSVSEGPGSGPIMITASSPQVTVALWLVPQTADPALLWIKPLTNVICVPHKAA